MKRKDVIITASIQQYLKMLFELNFEAQRTLYECTLSSRPLQSVGEEVICQVYPSTTLQSSS